MASSTSGKVLRSSEPDLKVVLKYKNSDGKNSEKTYTMYGQIIAGLSNFFDTALSVEMKEKETREIILQNVSPDLFEKAMKFQQDMLSVHCMTFDDAVEVLSFYHLYEFRGGLSLCDGIVSGHIASTKFDDLAHLADIMEMAHKHDLDASVKSGCEYLQKEFIGCPLRVSMLAIDQISSFVPCLKDCHWSLPEGLDSEDLDSLLFPKYLRSAMSCKFLVYHIYNRRRTPRLSLCVIEEASKYGFLSRAITTFMLGQNGWDSDRYELAREKGSRRKERRTGKSMINILVAKSFGNAPAAKNRRFHPGDHGSQLMNPPKVNPSFCLWTTDSNPNCCG
jgi:hypothetical protein